MSHPPKPRAPQQVQILSQEEPEMRDRLDEMKEAIDKLSSEAGCSPHDYAVQDILFSILEELTQLRKATEEGAST